MLPAPAPPVEPSTAVRSLITESASEGKREEALRERGMRGGEEGKVSSNSPISTQEKQHCSPRNDLCNNLKLNNYSVNMRPREAYAGIFSNCTRFLKTVESLCI